MSALLEVRQLKKHYSKRKGWFSLKSKITKAIDGIDFTVQKGEIVALVGESGSGKSTAALCAMHLIKPTHGTVHFMGKNLNEVSPKELRLLRREIQLIFQNPLTSLNPRKTILDNITDSLKTHKLIKNEEERRLSGALLLEKVGIDREALSQYPHQFSGGQQQRISIGRALALNPKLIICDEAVSALDLSVQAEILNLLYQLKKDFDLSYLFISHDLSVVYSFCDRILVMYRGKIVESAPRDQLFNNPKHPYTQMLLNSRLKRHPREKSTLFAQVMDKGEEHAGCPFFSRCPVRQASCKDNMPITKYDRSNDHGYNCIH